MGITEFCREHTYIHIQYISFSDQVYVLLLILNLKIEIPSLQSTCYKEKKMSHWKSLTLNCRQGGGHCMHGYLCINASVYNIPLCLFPFPSSALVLLLQISFTVSFFFFTSPFPLCHSSQPLYWNWGQRAVHPNLIMPERIVSVSPMCMCGTAE